MKKDKGSSYSLIDRLFYHDAYLLFDNIKKFNIKNTNWLYSCSLKTKEHTIAAAIAAILNMLFVVDCNFDKIVLNIINLVINLD